MWDNGKRSIKLDQAEFIDVSSLGRDYISNVASQEVSLLFV